MSVSRLVCAVLSVLLSCVWSAAGERDLAVAAELVRVDYCAGPEKDLDQLRLHLRLKVTNTHAAPVVVHRPSVMVHGVRAASTIDAFEQEEFDADVHVNVLPAEMKLTSDQFMVLKPGEFFEQRDVIPVLVGGPDTELPGVRPFASGDHVVRVYLDTWVWSERDFVKWGHHFAKHGKLHGRRLESALMPFHLEHASRQKCGNQDEQHQVGRVGREGTAGSGTPSVRTGRASG